MRHIFRVTVTMDDGDNWDIWNVEAKDDVDAREKGIAMTKAEHGSKSKIEYAEIKHIVEFED